MTTTLHVATSTVPVKLTKVAIRCRYDIAGYESGGLTWVDVLDKDRFKDGYLVEMDGKVIGLVYKHDSAEWSGQKPATLPEGALPVGAYGFASVLYSGKTRYEAVAKIVYWATRPTY